MKIIEVIGRVDENKPNSYSTENKIEWLSKLDLIIENQILKTHEGKTTEDFKGYNEETNTQTELLAPAPYDSMYQYWLEAQIDLANGEYNKYNVSITLFNTEFQTFENYYNRNNMPISKSKSFMF